MYYEIPSGHSMFNMTEEEFYSVRRRELRGGYVKPLIYPRDRRLKGFFVVEGADIPESIRQWFKASFGWDIMPKDKP